MEKLPPSPRLRDNGTNTTINRTARKYFNNIAVSNNARAHFGDQHIINYNTFQNAAPDYAEPQKPRSMFLIPYARDAQFIGREDDLMRIDAAFESAAAQKSLRRVVLTGLGGAG